MVSVYHCSSHSWGKPSQSPLQWSIIPMYQDRQCTFFEILSYNGVNCGCGLISLHIRSMWETICDAWACWSGWKFGPNSTEYPYSEIQNTPPPENWNLARSWHFVIFQFQNTPPPPPPENWNLGRSWHFVTFQFQNTPPHTPPTPENWN